MPSEKINSLLDKFSSKVSEEEVFEIELLSGSEVVSSEIVNKEKLLKIFPNLETFVNSNQNVFSVELNVRVVRVKEIPTLNLIGLLNSLK